MNFVQCLLRLNFQFPQNRSQSMGKRQVFQRQMILGQNQWTEIVWIYSLEWSNRSKTMKHGNYFDCCSQTAPINSSIQRILKWKNAGVYCVNNVRVFLCVTLQFIAVFNFCCLFCSLDFLVARMMSYLLIHCHVKVLGQMRKIVLKSISPFN